MSKSGFKRGEHSTILKYYYEMLAKKAAEKTSNFLKRRFKESLIKE